MSVQIKIPGEYYISVRVTERKAALKLMSFIELVSLMPTLVIIKCSF